MRKKQGVTLMEMMIAVTMFAILSSAFTYVFFIALKNWNYQLQRFELREPAIWCSENISKDLRPARSITTGQARRLTFTTSAYETIDYNLANRTLNNGVWTWQLVRTYTLSTTPATTITSAVAKNIAEVSGTPGIANLTFSYYNSSGTLIAAPVPPLQLANIRSISITITFQSVLLTSTETVTFRTQVRPRNL